MPSPATYQAHNLAPNEGVIDMSPKDHGLPAHPRPEGAPALEVVAEPIGADHDQTLPGDSDDGVEFAEASREGDDFAEPEPFEDPAAPATDTPPTAAPVAQAAPDNPLMAQVLEQNRLLLEMLQGQAAASQPRAPQALSPEDEYAMAQDPAYRDREFARLKMKRGDVLHEGVFNLAVATNGNQKELGDLKRRIAAFEAREAQREREEHITRATATIPGDPAALAAARKALGALVDSGMSPDEALKLVTSLRGKQEAPKPPPAAPRPGDVKRTPVKPGTTVDQTIALRGRSAGRGKTQPIDMREADRRLIAAMSRR